MTGLQFLVAGGILYVLAVARGAARPVRAHWKVAFVLGFLLVLCGNGGVVWGEQTVPSGLAAPFVSLEALLIVLLDWAERRRSRPGWGAIAGSLLGFSGIILLIAPGHASRQMLVNPAGAAALLAASVAWALGSIYSRGARVPESPLLATA